MLRFRDNTVSIVFNFERRSHRNWSVEWRSNWHVLRDHRSIPRQREGKTRVWGFQRQNDLKFFSSRSAYLLITFFQFSFHMIQLKTNQHNKKQVKFEDSGLDWAIYWRMNLYIEIALWSEKEKGLGSYPPCGKHYVRVMPNSCSSDSLHHSLYFHHSKIIVSFSAVQFQYNGEASRLSANSYYSYSSLTYSTRQILTKCSVYNERKQNLALILLMFADEPQNSVIIAYQINK